MRRALGVPLVLFALVLGVYLANGRTIGAGDTLPAAYLPWALLQQGTVRLDGVLALHDDRARRVFALLDGIPYYLLRRSGHYVSAYGPGAGVLAAPIYAPAILAGSRPEPASAARLEKLSAAVITALSVVVLHRALLRVTSPGWALVVALVYAFGTSSLSTSSQGLWQHGPSQLFVALTIYCLVRGREDVRFLAYAGFPMAAAVAMRSTDLFLVAPVAAWILYAHRVARRGLVLCALAPTLALAAYHVALFAVPDRGLGSTTAPLWALFTQASLRESLPAVLVGPSRGLFVYSPVLLFSLVGMVVVWRRGPALWRALSLGPPLVVVVISAWITWWGGQSWGPRLLADLAPVLAFFLTPVTRLLDRSRALKGAFAALALWSVAAHGLGAWLYDRRWDNLVSDRAYARLSRWGESPLAFYGREGLLRLGRALDGGRGRADASAVARGSLAASYTVGPLREVTAGERFTLRVAATNVGTEVWRAGVPGARGSVVLVWRWYRGEHADATGGRDLLADVPPGGTARFEAPIVAPVVPGEYTLALDLVSHEVAWFHEHGGPEARLSVAVVPRDLARTLSAPLPAAAGAPTAAVAIDRASYRAGDVQKLTVELANPHRPRNLDAYLVLESRDGPPLFFDGRVPPRRIDDAWPPWVRALPLPARATGRFTLPLDALPPGEYRWHVLLTDPGAYRPVARAVAEFRIAP